MKRFTLSMMLAAVLIVLLNACKGKDSQANIKFNIDNNFFMLTADTLPQSVDLTQDISNLNYQNLRLLRSYVYAIHGHWFMEGDLNRFFANHTTWYEGLCYLEIEEKPYEEGIAPELCDSIKEYAQALWQNYPHAYELVNLSAAEKEFVNKIDQRMAELMDSKEYAGEDDALLLNPNLLTNWYQVSNPEPELASRLIKSNVAFNRTNLEQLFQVYEENDYHMMPNFITTDLLLQAYHMYFSYTLTSLERYAFSDKLADVFTEIAKINSLATKSCSKDSVLQACNRNTAAYCAVALKLLGKKAEVPSQLQALVNEEVANVMAGEDKISPLFKTEVNFNYSLFKPRGHYTRTEADKRYFRAMQWLQKGCFYREKADQLKWAIYLAQIINMMPSEKMNELSSLNKALTFMMGEPDNLSLLELASELKNLPISKMDDAVSSANVTAADTWLQKEFKSRNRISPKVVEGPQDQLNLMPQRYTIDGDILGRLFDEKQNADRAYPKGLDVFAAFGVRAAKNLLDTCYHTKKLWKGYQQSFDSISNVMKDVQDWNKTFYNKWLEDLIVLQKPSKSQPGFMQTSTWQLKNLNTGLASWALLKHDAILYAEQPMGAECGGGGLPDPWQVGYVEPNIAFWKKLKETVDLNRKMLKDNDYLTEDLAEKTDRLQEYVDFCLRISEQEINGETIKSEDFYTFNRFGSDIEYFTLSVLDPDQEIWMWSDVKGADRNVAQVADVFTRNILNCPKDGILYEATGAPNAIYVIVEINGQCYLTRGATYSYYEFVRPLDQPRLTDEEWQKMLQDESTTPAPTEWFAPLLMGKPVEADERYVYSTGC